MIVCSTIIPTINRPTLERAVRSALEQNLGPELHEIIVFNNSDQLLPKTDWHMSPQITIVNSHANYYYATNKGAEMAKGIYINFLDDDDFLLPGALNALLDRAISTKCVWVYGAYNLMDNDGNFMYTVPAEVRGNLLALFLAGENLHFASSLVHRETYIRAGGMDPEIKVWGDLDLCCQTALLGDFDCINQTVAIVRLSGGSGSSFDYSALTQDKRKIREKVLNSHDVLARIQNSVQSDVFLRGRACRAYIFSTVLNILAGRIIVAGGRAISLLRLAGFYLALPDFWRGLYYRGHWLSNDQKKQEKHFAKYQLLNNNEKQK